MPFGGLVDFGLGCLFLGQKTTFLVTNLYVPYLCKRLDLKLDFLTLCQCWVCDMHVKKNSTRLNFNAKKQTFLVLCHISLNYTHLISSWLGDFRGLVRKNIAFSFSFQLVNTTSPPFSIRFDNISQPAFYT